MGDVGEVIVELDDMLEAGADRGERVLEVDEGLLRLGAKITGRADDLAVEVEAELAGNEDDPPRPGRLDHMGVSDGLGDRVRVEKLMLRHGRAPWDSFGDASSAVAQRMRCMHRHAPLLARLAGTIR